MKHILLTTAFLTCAHGATALAQEGARAPADPFAAAGAWMGALPQPEREAAARIDLAELRAHIAKLASDEFEGRAPATRGEVLTINYIASAFERAGLAPGNPDGTWFQDVPLSGYRSKTQLSLKAGERAIEMEPLRDFVALSRRMQPVIEVESSELVFVGYGVQAPEYGWDDYKGLDVRGKTLVMLVNDPPVPTRADPLELDPGLFRGEAMTYYGRWTYKYEIASQLGAAAALIVHETGPAGYPFAVVAGSWGRENFDTRATDGNAGRVAVEGWLSEKKARELLSAGGADFDALKQAACSRDFRPVPLTLQGSYRVENEFRDVPSKNVVGLLRGSDPERASEYVVYTAHWDHLGRDESLQGDQIFNGAVDNASGVAALLELAQAFAALKPAPQRSILFLAVTAEEKGLLGAKHYAGHPLYPLDQTVANINIDAMNPWGRTTDVSSIGLGHTTMDELLEQKAALQGRVVVPDAEPSKGIFYRSDHFEFAKQGVPALYADGGSELRGRAPGLGKQRMAEFTERHYHKVSDELGEDWDLAGAVEDAQLAFLVGLELARSANWPAWKDGSEFKAVLEARKRAGKR